MKLGIDARLLLEKDSGEARYLQAMLASLAAKPEVQTTLLVPVSAIDTLRARYAETNLRVADEKTARRNAYDLVWFPSAIMRFHTQSPTVLSLNELSAFTHPPTGFFTRRKVRGGMRRSVRDAKARIVASAWARDEAAKLFGNPADDFTLIEPTPAATWYPDLESTPSTELGEMPFIVVIPQAHAEAELQIFFRACAHALAKRRVRVVLCGDLPTRLERTFSKISHTSVLHPDETLLRSLYRTAVAVAIPVSYDGFSFEAAEAAACGAALLVGASGSLPEIIGDAGLVVSAVKQRRAWSDAIKQLVEHEGYNARLRARAVTQWSLQARNTHVDRLLAFFESVRAS